MFKRNIYKMTDKIHKQTGVQRDFPSDAAYPSYEEF